MYARIISCLVSVLLIPSAGNFALAVKNGELDGENHPHVGLMVALDENGILLTSRSFLTAGHCVEGVARATIWFDADVEAGIPENGYPIAGEVSGDVYLHPEFNPNAFYLKDVGVVVLDDDVHR